MIPHRICVCVTCQCLTCIVRLLVALCLIVSYMPSLPSGLLFSTLVRNISLSSVLSGANEGEPGLVFSIGVFINPWVESDTSPYIYFRCLLMLRALVRFTIMYHLESLQGGAAIFNAYLSHIYTWDTYSGACDTSHKWFYFLARSLEFWWRHFLALVSQIMTSVIYILSSV